MNGEWPLFPRFQKKPNPANLSEYRPISVTCLLSRLAERLFIKRFLQPSISEMALNDQFASRPTGSTTSALVSLIHKVTKSLESCNYVRCLMIDFSSAFDVVDRSLLLEKLCTLNVPGSGIDWLPPFSVREGKLPVLAVPYLLRFQ